MRSTKADRPRKRQGNFKDNPRAAKQHAKTNTFRQAGKKKSDGRQFSR